jgi:hypothetical protein
MLGFGGAHAPPELEVYWHLASALAGSDEMNQTLMTVSSPMVVVCVF